MRRFLLILLAMSAAVLADAMLLKGVEHRVDTLYHYQVGPGTWYTQVRATRASDGGGRLDIYLLQIDRRNPYVSMHTVLANDSLLTGERPSHMAQRMTAPGRNYFAGTNGDWWSTDRPGVPEGAFVTEGTLAITPENGRAGLAMCAIDQADSLYFGHDFFTDVYVTDGGADTLRCSHVNDTRYPGELVLYNRYNGVITHTDDNGSELICRIPAESAWGTNTTMRIVVEQVRPDRGNSPLDPDHVVLSASGADCTFLERFLPGDTLQLLISASINDIYADFKAALGGQDRDFMLYEGEPNETWDERHPRTGLGFSQSGDTIIQCVVDGRGASIGCSCGTLGEIMKHFGAWWAMNMEGGGSSSMNILKVGVMNVPSDGNERAESQGLFAVSSAPADESLARLTAYEEVLRMPLYGQYSPKVLGYNRYDDLIDIDVPDVELSCDSATGYMQDDRTFVCLGSGLLYLRKGNAEGVVRVVLDSVANPAFRLDSVLISSHKGYTVQTEVRYPNKVVYLTPSVLTWESLDPSVTTVSADGLITAVAPGLTRVVGTLDGITDTLLVRVQEPESDPFRWSDMHECASEWTMKASSSAWKTSVVQLSDSLYGLSFNYSNVRQANIKFTANAPLFSTPDTFCLRLTPNGFPIQRIIVRLRANNQFEAQSVTDTVQDVHAPVDIRIPLPQLFGAEGDMAIYPVFFESVVFYLDANLPAGPYTMALDGIWLSFRKEPASWLDSVQAPASSLIWRDGLILVRRGSRLYDLQGRLVE